MKNLFVLALVTVFVFAFSTCSDEPTSVNQEPANHETALMKSGPSANGQGTLIFDGAKQTFSFHAREVNGEVKGSIQVKMRNLFGTDLDYIVHGEITCMLIEGNMATLAGKIIRDNNVYWELVQELWPWYECPECNYFWFRVIDNGEGANSPPDQFSDIFIPVPNYPCDMPLPPDYPYLEIVNGNFQVKP